ncbi:MAG TPA: GNAT family N-acetyltransferase [Candidatus Binataceae bacterium]|nr:GNAT family N-acetyltransferase [Candidatus Binataceae bacterium]
MLDERARPYAIVAKLMRRAKSIFPAAQVRTARERDLPALEALYRELHLDSYESLAVSPARMRAAFRRLARDRDHRILVAESGGRIVGTVHLIVVPHLGHGLKPFAIVENVVVTADARSLGVGEAMMDAAAALAVRRGCYKLALTTNVRRTRAHRFYERLGWRRTHHGYSLGNK